MHEERKSWLGVCTVDSRCLLMDDLCTQIRFVKLIYEACVVMSTPPQIFSALAKCRKCHHIIISNFHSYINVHGNVWGHEVVTRGITACSRVLISNCGSIEACLLCVLLFCGSRFLRIPLIISTNSQKLYRAYKREDKSSYLCSVLTSIAVCHSS